MALLIWSLLLSIPIPFVRAGPLSTESLTPYLSTIVPTCAQDCLQSFISVNFPTVVCSPQNFNCLCITPSLSGYTLGEGALMCLVSSCLEQTVTTETSVYEICRSIPDTLPNIHSTLTATYTPTTSDNSQPSSSASSSGNNKGYTQPSPDQNKAPSNQPISNNVSGTRQARLTSSSTPSLNPSPSASTSSNFVSSPSPSSTAPPTPANFNGSPAPTRPALPTTPSPSNTAITTPATSSAGPPPPQALTKPQLAGVVVASVGAAGLVLGLCLLLACFRRRKIQRRNSDSSFVGDKHMDSEDGTPDMATIAARDFAHEDPSRNKSPQGKSLTLMTPANTSEIGWQRWAKNNDPHNIGLGLGSELSGSTSKERPSPISHRTDSQLLPDKPTYSLFPPPLRTGPDSRRTSHNPTTPAYDGYGSDRSPPMTGPRFPSAIDTSQAHLQRRTNVRSLSDPFYDSATSPPPREYRGIPRTDLSTTIRKPLPAQQSPSARGMWAQSATESQQPNLPQTYPPPPPLPDKQYLAAMERQHSRKHPPRKKSNSSSQYTRFSNGSETSFEDADEDPLPLLRSALSPVAEVRSPPRHSSKVSYPPVPPTAAESPSRIINRPRPPYRSESLLAKRRRDEKAAELPNDMQRDDARRSAKWKILVSPGLGPLDNSSDSNSPPTTRSVERTPPMGR